MDVDKLLAIKHMLQHDAHTRRHWAFWTVMSEMSPYMCIQFEDRGLEPPCGAVGCAIGHAYRMGIIATDYFTGARDELRMDRDDFDYIFENDVIGRDHDTPDDVVRRIDKVLENHTPVLVAQGDLNVFEVTIKLLKEEV